MNDASGKAAIKPRTSPWMIALQVFAVLWAGLCIWQDVDSLALNAHADLRVATIGITRDRGGDVPGYVRVTAVTPGSPAERAGIGSGDLIHFDNPQDFTIVVSL